MENMIAAHDDFMHALAEYVDARIDDADRANRRDSYYSPKASDLSGPLGDALAKYVRACVVVALQGDCGQ